MRQVTEPGLPGDLERDTQGEEDAIPQHEQHGSRRRVAGAEDGVAGHQRGHGGAEQDEIPAGQEGGPGRLRGPRCCHKAMRLHAFSVSVKFARGILRGNDPAFIEGGAARLVGSAPEPPGPEHR